MTSTDATRLERMLARQPWLADVPSDPGAWLRFEHDGAYTPALGSAVRFHVGDGYALTAQSIRRHLRLYADLIGADHATEIERSYRGGEPIGLRVCLQHRD